MYFHSWNMEISEFHSNKTKETHNFTVCQHNLTRTFHIVSYYKTNWVREQAEQERKST